MSPLFFVLVVVATASLWGGGYAFGSRKGRTARAALADEWEARGTRIELLESEVARSNASKPPSFRGELEQALAPLLSSAKKDSGVEVLRGEVQTVLETIAVRERSNDAFRSEVRNLLSEVAKKSEGSAHVEDRLRTVLAPLLAERAERGEGERDMRRIIDEALEPLRERETLGHDLSTIHVGSGNLADLPALLDAIATKAGFSSVVLSDESGLPLAASAGSMDVDGISGTAAFFVTLAERAERASLPRPLSCVVLDETNRITVHRLFSVGDTRFNLSAVSRGRAMAPGVLDPALLPLERVLGRKELS